MAIDQSTGAPDSDTRGSIDEPRRALSLALLLAGFAPWAAVDAQGLPASRVKSQAGKPCTSTEGDYPSVEAMRHGDIVFPRRVDVDAISTVPDALRALVALSSNKHTSATGQAALLNALRKTFPPPLARQGDQTAATRKRTTAAGTLKRSFDLVAYWPKLLGYLSQVRDGLMTLDQFLMTVVKDLGGPAALKDASEAIFAKQYVGHCGIIDLSIPGEPWVIESSHAHGGLRCIPYAEWKAEREDHKALVWLYRLDALEDRKDPAEVAEVELQRTRFVNVAHRCRMQGVPYAIFDSKRDGSKFELDMCQVRGVGELPYLYCSELVYYCAQQSLGIELVKKPSGCAAAGAQFGMVTPKDLANAGPVCRKSGKGIYSRDLELVDI